MFLKKRYPYNFTTSSLLLIYKCIWTICFPLVVAYFLKRSIKEKNYRKNLLERFGFGKNFLPNSIWIHAVSLGEFRAAVPLIKALIKRSERILLTTITPAGREEAERILKSELEVGNIHLVYLPLEYDFAFNQFFNRYKPKLTIVLEIELWPVLISACSRHEVPLILAQGQYVKKSFMRDKKLPWFRGALFNGFDLILAKSQVHADRYKFFCRNAVEVMGELRFDQAIPQAHLSGANLFLQQLNLDKKPRTCFCFGSTGPGEDTGLISLMSQLNNKAEEIGLPKPFYVYVPRHKKDFSRIARDIADSGLKFRKRSEILDNNLALRYRTVLKGTDIDGIIGDSLGEITFYFQMADYVFIGNSFNNLGSHNVIEPLALKKPVVVGPSVWGIEYPIVEALEAGIIVKVQNIEELFEYWLSQMVNNKKVYKRAASLEAFYDLHSGAAERCICKLQDHQFLKS